MTMKKGFLLLLITACIFSLAGCEPQNELIPDDDNQETPTPGPEDGTDPEDGKDPEQGTDPEDGTDPEQPQPDTPVEPTEFPFFEDYPLEVGNLMAEGSDVGVTIEVTKVEHQNFVFELRPGALVQSFKLDVFPLAQLYNSFINDGMAGCQPYDLNEKIRSYIFNTSGSGGYEFSINDFDNPEDFLQIEFDWMNTSYAAASAIAIPDCDYVIAVVACMEPAASSARQQDLTLCYVHTTSEPLVGDPQCDIEVNTGYRKFAVNHIPNSDAAGVYFFGYLTEEIDAYIDAFGDTMFRDFMRTRVTSPSPASDPDALMYSVDYGEAADASIMSTTCAVAVDANLTPQEGYSRRDFHLEEIPEEQEIVVPAVTIIEERVAAAYFEFYAEMPKDCNTIFYRVYTEDQMESLMNASSLDQKKEAIDLVNNGYGCHNPNFLWDKKAEQGSEAIGSAGKVKLEYYGGLQPGETYYIGYTGRNGYGTPGPLTFSEPIVLDERNLDSYKDCKVKDLELKLDNPGRTQFRANITYDPETVSMVYIQYMTADANPGLWIDSSWNEWVSYIFTPSASGTGSIEYSNLDVNAWPTLESGYDPFTWTGMIPDTEYTVFLCAEDFDGNISEMHFASITTSEIQVGPDPTIRMSLEPSTVNPYDWTVKYEIDHDVEYFLYCYTEGPSELAQFIPGLNQGHLNNIADSGYDYETWYNGIYSWVAGGFENNGGGMRAESDTSQNWEGDHVVIAACIAVGRDEEGEPVYKLYHLICKDGKAQTLEEIFGVTE